MNQQTPLDLALKALEKIPELIQLQHINNLQIQSLMKDIDILKGTKTQKTNKKTYTVKEVSEKLSVCEESVRRKIKSGELKAGRHFRTYLISEDSINDFIKRG